MIYHPGAIYHVMFRGDRPHAGQQRDKLEIGVRSRVVLRDAPRRARSERDDLDSHFLRASERNGGKLEYPFMVGTRTDADLPPLPRLLLLLAGLPEWALASARARVDGTPRRGF